MAFLGHGSNYYCGKESRGLFCRYKISRIFDVGRVVLVVVQMHCSSKELELYASREIANDGVVDDTRLIRSQVERCRTILRRMSVRGAEPAGEPLELVSIQSLLEPSLREKFCSRLACTDSTSTSMTASLKPCFRTTSR